MSEDDPNCANGSGRYIIQRVTKTSSRWFIIRRVTKTAFMVHIHDALARHALDVVKHMG